MSGMHLKSILNMAYTFIKWSSLSPLMYLTDALSFKLQHKTVMPNTPLIPHKVIDLLTFYSQYISFGTIIFKAFLILFVKHKYWYCYLCGLLTSVGSLFLQLACSEHLICAQLCKRSIDLQSLIVGSLSFKCKVSKKL